MTTPIRLCFVCLGNICRSPMAEGIFIRLATDRGVIDRFTIDSCGTGDWHIGERPDPRAIACASGRGTDLPSRARTLDDHRDGARFDLLLAMDRSNHDTMIARGIPASRVRMMRSFDPTIEVEGEGDNAAQAPDVPDPYWSEDDGFEQVYDMLERACNGMLDELLSR